MVEVQAVAWAAMAVSVVVVRRPLLLWLELIEVVAKVSVVELRSN
jgi:hypothetical protein